ncbi:hypothetical protein T265_05524 [Opisthorchis viverrini]|uniref:Uncharacterized protein n=1 Tax=Opisthorchis viverrini TaxID=6198 RepID=A0A075AF69_OPIVI|nr:hypothetical protein T265_05524 [Opisthorchis viverrini]KER27419.1 hypothetical protein T265_05524 [Opisthorchis viverrini]
MQGLHNVATPIRNARSFDELAKSRVFIRTARPSPVTKAAKPRAQKREAAKPRQPYTLLAVSLSAACRVFHWAS